MTAAVAMQATDEIPVIQIGRGAYWRGDCSAVMRSLLDQGFEGSVDSIITDPPYGLGFMGRSWDAADNVVFRTATWELALRLLRPGGHLLAFGAPRTYHRLVCAVEDAGFDVRDQLAWLYGHGTPHGLDVCRAVSRQGRDGSPWSGWNTALKPGHEPIVVARKPLVGTVADNVLLHGVGAFHVDACRVEGRERSSYGLKNAIRSQGSCYGTPSASADFDATVGRYPANVVHDGSGVLGSEGRFFYAARATAAERARTAHPTVKPLSLMRYLVRLVNPIAGVVLDPFCGSGTTLEAAVLEGCFGVGIELNDAYWSDIESRLSRCQPEEDNDDEEVLLQEAA